jgi:hypothetical protein
VHESSIQRPVSSTQTFSVTGLLAAGNWIPFLLCCRQMWGAYRWAARFLMVVMLVPALAPMAMPCAALPQGAHCMRRTVSAQPTQPMMQCHHAMAESRPPQPESLSGESSQASAQASFQAADNDDCCKNHCCCGAKISEWAQPASSLLSFFSLLIEPAQPLPGSAPQSTDFSGNDSARAPPPSCS